jgi:hypothetical protein
MKQRQVNVWCMAPPVLPLTVTGEVPQEMLGARRDELANCLGVLAKEVEMVRAQTVIWTESSRGCAKPDQAYTQALVPGYWIILSQVDRHFDYRGSEAGYPLLCEKALPPKPHFEREPTQR